MEIEHTPHYRYPNWPGKTIIYFRQGSASLQNLIEGTHLFIRVSGQERDHVACLELEETQALYDQLGYALEEQRRLVAETQELHK